MPPCWSFACRFSITLSIFEKNVVAMLIAIALSMYIAFGTMSILIILILQIHIGVLFFF